MRCFFACALNKASKTELAARIGDITPWRTVSTDSFHVTLHFVGSIRQPDLQPLLDLNQQLNGHSIKAALRKITGYPKKRPRVLVAELPESGKLVTWHTKLRHGWPTQEKKPYRPHVTLARTRSPIDLPCLQGLIDLEVRLERPQLFRSDTLASGVVYTQLSD